MAIWPQHFRVPLRRKTPMRNMMNSWCSATDNSILAFLKRDRRLFHIWKMTGGFHFNFWNKQPNFIILHQQNDRKSIFGFINLFWSEPISHDIIAKSRVLKWYHIPIFLILHDIMHVISRTLHHLHHQVISVFLAVIEK